MYSDSGRRQTNNLWKEKRTLRVTLIVSVVNDLWCSNDGNDGILRVCSLLAGYGKLMGHPDVGIFEEAFQSLVLEELLIQGPGQRIDGLEKIDSRSILQATSIPTCERIVH